MATLKLRVPLASRPDAATLARAHYIARIWRRDLTREFARPVTSSGYVLPPGTCPSCWGYGDHGASEEDGDNGVPYICFACGGSGRWRPPARRPEVTHG